MSKSLRAEASAPLKKNGTEVSIVDKGLLYDFYGELLTDRQKDIYESAVCHDMSLAEIAQEFGITRQGVSEQLQSCTRALQKYEAKLRLVEKSKKVNVLCDKLEKESDSAKLRAGIRKIRSILEM